METKKRNRHLGIMILVGFLLIVIGIISYIVINYNNDQAEVKMRMDAVLESYDTFKSDVDSFNNIRDSIYTDVMQDTYYQTIKDNDTHYKELFESYKESLEVIDNDYSELEDKCVNVLYPLADVNNKCEAIIVGYEEVVNTYISDVTSYNNLIDSYNKWLDINNSNDPKLEEIKLDRDYLDLDGDREYAGKSDIKTEITDEEENGAMPDE